jgi:hypothetical protein
MSVFREKYSWRSHLKPCGEGSVRQEKTGWPWRDAWVLVLGIVLKKIAESFHLGKLPPDFVLAPDYNAAPKTFQPVIRLNVYTGDAEPWHECSAISALRREGSCTLACENSVWGK